MGCLRALEEVSDNPPTEIRWYLTLSFVICKKRGLNQPLFASKILMLKALAFPPFTYAKWQLHTE